MLIEITYNVTDVYMSTTETPVYVEISFEQPSGSAAVWGSITGTLSNQTDLQNALNAKFDDPTGTSTQYIDGTGALQTFPLTLPVLQEVRNQTGATLDAGTVVYINGATGNKPTVTKAIATGDATSAQTLGMISAAIANNGVGYVVVIGTCGGLDTSAYTEGQQLYLSYTTAGAVTTTKPYAPNHLVYVGIVTRSHPNLGTIEVRVQNGFEMDEIHNVSAQTPSNNDGLFYNTTTSLWESKSITTALGYTPVPTTRNITINGVTYDLSADRTYTISTGISGSGASGQVTYWTGASAVSGSNNLFWDNANGRLGIGTNVPAQRLDILGSTNSGQLVNIKNSNNGSAAVAGFQAQSDTGAGSLFITSSGYTPFGVLAANTLGFYASGNVNIATVVNSTGYYSIGTGSSTPTEKLRVFNNGNVLIQNGGTFSDLGVRLGVVGDTLLRGSGATSATTALTVQNSSSTNLLRVLNNGNVSFGADAMFWDAANNRLGIGTNAPARILDIAANINSGTEQIRIKNSNTGSSATSAIAIESDGAYSALIATSSTYSALSFLGPNAIGFYATKTFSISIAANNEDFKIGIGSTLTQRLRLYGATGNLVLQNGGTFTDNGQRLQVYGDTLLRGSGATSATTALTVQNSSSTNLFTVRNDGLTTFGGNMTISLNQNAITSFSISNTTSGTSSQANINLISNSGTQAVLGKYSSTTTAYKTILSNDFYIYNNPSFGDISILNDNTSGSIKFAAGGSSTVHLTIKANGTINMSSLPTSSTGLVAGDLWNDAGTIKIV